MNEEAKKEFIAVTGATASGKTALSVELALRLDGEVVSCDSMQIYRGMDIGTAKPSREERRGVPHHMLDILPPDAPFSAGDYAREAGRVIENIISRGKTPVMCGGTFLYLDSLISISSLSESEKDEGVRRELMSFAEKEGNSALHRMLAEIDPDAAMSIHENNVKRVIRAIEIYKTTGKTKTQWDRESKESAPPFSAKIIVIDYKNRDALYERINRRVDIMMENGLEAEAEELFKKGFLDVGCSAAQAIGYKEFIPYFKGESTLGETAELIKRQSRNYAKRQLTWLKRYKNALHIEADLADGSVRGASELADEALQRLSEA